ncbi:Metallo-dependent phosphatase-like protein [Mucidula mucida]|nr:Metallo-dependent phosphatase-like protein [Mucidula mucida]
MNNLPDGAVVLEEPDVHVHIEYNQLPPVPDPETWTRFVCISDTHHHKFPVPHGDVLLHSGDLTNTGKYVEFKTTMEWLYSLPHKVKIIIAGNHDLSLHQKDGWYDKHYDEWGAKETACSRLTGLLLIEPLLIGEQARAAGIVYVCDERVEFDAKGNGQTWSLYGSPVGHSIYSSFYHDLKRRPSGLPNSATGHSTMTAERAKLVSQFPKTDILLTHGPPLHIFDVTSRQALAGCRDLANRLPYLRPRIHLFGHIHEGHGAYIHTWKAGETTAPKVQTIETGPDWEPHIDADYYPTIERRGDRTVFVNGANWPMGERTRLYRSYDFGGPGFRPIVVDLKDCVSGKEA